MKIIGIAGLARSGKDTAADYLVRKHGFQKIVLSDLIAVELKKKDIEPSKKNLMEMGDKLRKKHGQGIVGRMAAEKIQKEGLQSVIVVGFRSVEEIEHLKGLCPGFKLIVIKTDREKRFQRREDYDPDSQKEFFERDKIDIQKKGFELVIEKADFKINNSDSLEALFESLEMLMQKL